MDIELKLEDAEARKALKALVAKGRDLSPVTRRIAALLKSATERAFRKQEDPTTGKAWAALSDVTLAQREAAGYVGEGGARKLQRNRDLIQSIIADFDPVTAVVGTNLVYAATHQFGAEKGEFGSGSYATRKGSFPIPWGDIPARPFLGFNDKDAEKIHQVVANYLTP